MAKKGKTNVNRKGSKLPTIQPPSAYAAPPPQGFTPPPGMQHPAK